MTIVSAVVIGMLVMIAGTLANRMVVLPRQNLPDLSKVPRFTLLSLLSS